MYPGMCVYTACHVFNLFVFICICLFVFVHAFHITKFWSFVDRSHHAAFLNTTAINRVQYLYTSHLKSCTILKCYGSRWDPVSST